MSLPRTAPSPRYARLRQALALLVWAGAIVAEACGADAVSGITQRPLATRSGPRGATLFATLPPEQTGISAVNRYDDPSMWAQHYREFTLGAIGTGVAIGDFDGDGRPDVFVVCKTGENHLFRNLGGFKFEDVTARAGVGGPAGPWKQGATFVDVNNDGRLDLYVCRFGAPNLLYVNQGDGTFKEEAAARGLAIVDASNQAAFADYDRDGFLDVYLQTNVLDGEAHPNGQRDYLFHNKGDGTFTDVTDHARISGETQGHSATWWDYNEDGWPDLYVANDFKDPDQLYRNNGDGTFTNVLSWVVPHTPHSSMGADLGDVNNDGHIDLLVADMAATTRYKDQRGMAKVRAGLPDADANPNAAPQYMRNALFLNTGTSHMLEAAFLTGLDATDWTWTVRLEDLDNDGWIDPLFTNGMVRELHGVDLLNRLLPLENLTERTRLMRASPPLTEHNLVFRNRGDLLFENVSAAWGLDQLGVSFGGALGDLDGDGDLDFVFANYEGEVTVCRNDSDTGHRVIFDLHGTVSNRYGIGSVIQVQTSKANQVRPLLLARGYLSSSEPAVHFGLGEAETITRVLVHWPSGIVQTFENLSADRRYEITEPAARIEPLSRPPPHDPEPRGLFADETTQRNLALTSKERPLNEWSRQPLLPFRLNRQGPAAAIGDLDGDGEDDLAVGGAMGDAPRFFSNLGDGNFLPYGDSAFSDRTQTADAGILLFDANGDGTNDFLQTKGGSAKESGDAAYQPRLYLNDGHGHFAPAADALPPISISASTAVALDFNRDGKLDLFIAGRMVPGKYSESPNSVLLENQGGRFVDVTDASAPGLRKIGMVTAALSCDVDGDGWADLLLTLDWGHVCYFHNEQGHGFKDLSSQSGFAAAGTGWWKSIASGDFNRDGRPDFVVGNVGLNTRYRSPSSEHPAVLLAGEFDASGRTQLIEAQYEGDQLYPIRGLPQLGPVLPSLARKFSSYDAYARATLDQVIPNDRLAAVRRLEATEFRSGVFLSRPDGAYHFEPLPRLAQISPIFGLIALDFDGDGSTDLCCVQNSYAPISEVSRFDGGLGLLLRGDGKGHFAPVPPAESALIVTGDAKAMVALDLNADGWPDLFVTRNNGRTLALVNQGIAGRHSFAVRLRGVVGNPTAIGARVTVTLQDGTSEMAEVQAGAGYLSQSTASLFFGYPDGNLPKTLTVRWPDGRTSTHPWQPQLRKIVLSPPNP